MADEDKPTQGDAAGDKPLEGGADNPTAAGAEPTEAAAQAAEAPADEKDQRIAELEAELASMQDKLMRAAAEVQNTLKRAERDRRDAETYGGRKLARDLLAVYDNLDATLKHASEELQNKEASFFNGVELTRKELLNAFSKHRIEALEPDVGERFDPNRHQAMFEAPAPGAEPGTVLQVMQTGFVIADQLLRPAMVGVASKAVEAAPASDASQAGGSQANGSQANGSQANGGQAGGPQASGSQSGGSDGGGSETQTAMD